MLATRARSLIPTYTQALAGPALEGNMAKKHVRVVGVFCSFLTAAGQPDVVQVPLPWEKLFALAIFCRGKNSGHNKVVVADGFGRDPWVPSVFRFRFHCRDQFLHPRVVESGHGTVPDVLVQIIDGTRVGMQSGHPDLLIAFNPLPGLQATGTHLGDQSNCSVGLRRTRRSLALSSAVSCWFQKNQQADG
jgi:hypothetical protein